MSTQPNVRFHAFKGLVMGLTEPSIHVVIEHAFDEHHISRAHEFLLASFKKNNAPDELHAQPQKILNICEFLLFWTYQIQKMAALANVHTGKIIAGSTKQKIIIPCEGDLHLPMIELLRQLIKQATQGQAPNQNGLSKVFKTFQLASSTSSNTPIFLKTADQLGIQVSQILGGIYQFGQGVHSYWMESTFTEHTSNIASKLARNKRHASIVLSQSGLPVAESYIVSSLSEVQHYARKMQFPVVIKPSDLDGGQGVFADLQSDDELKEAFEAARKFSKRIMIEKHIMGNDYRLTVFRGKLIWAIERIPAGITGDGQHMISELITQLNADSRRGKGAQSSLKIVEVDDETMGLLKSQQLTLSSIPEAGQFVKLKRKSNVSAGGEPVSVMSKVHPDNALLAVNAAKALRLDFAGIDFIMPDISQSWLEVGGAICEINAQPQLGSLTSRHLYPEVLKQLVPHLGRIPIDLIVTDEVPLSNARFLNQERENLYQAGIGFYDGSHLFISGKRQSAHPISAFDAGSQCIRAKDVHRIVMLISPDAFLNTGLPFNRFDNLIVLELSQPESIHKFNSFIRLIGKSTFQKIRLPDVLKGKIPALAAASHTS